MGKSKIQWTGSTWNPIRARNKQTGMVGTHCVKVSSGCANCYAERHNTRLLPHGSSGLFYTAAGGANAEYFIDPKILSEPLRRRKPETYFVGSLTDLYMYPPEVVAALFGVMAATPQHTYQLLTKRPEMAFEFSTWISTRGNGFGPLAPREYCGSAAGEFVDHPQVDLQVERGSEMSWPLPNVWIGVSAENQEMADRRIPILLQCPAALRFVSYEPALGPADFEMLQLIKPEPPFGPGVYLDCLRGHIKGPDDMIPEKVDWIIVGGESGPGARLFDIAWARSVVEQCKGAGVPVFVKQLGAVLAGWTPDACFYCENLETEGDTCNKCGRVVVLIDTGSGFRQLGKLKDRKGGDMSEWPADLRVREMPEVPRG